MILRSLKQTRSFGMEGGVRSDVEMWGHPRGWKGIIMCAEGRVGKGVTLVYRVMLWGVVWTGRLYYIDISSNTNTLCDKWCVTEYIRWTTYWCQNLHGIHSIKNSITIEFISIYICFWIFLCIRPVLSNVSSKLRFTKHIYDHTWYKKYTGFYPCQQNIQNFW